MTSIVDNGTSPTAAARMEIVDMPQWKRDLIMRRRAQQQQQQQQMNKDNSAQQSASVSKQLDGCVDACNKSCACAASSSCGVESRSVTLGCWSARPPLGHQPTCCAAAHAPTCARSTACVSSSPVGGSSSSGGERERCAACCECQSTQPEPHTTCAPHSRPQHAMVHLHTEGDASEELKYGPGIVSKLKNRYLSLTLRETVIKRRPSILRKATSLENLLDDGPEPGEDTGALRAQLLEANEATAKSRRFEARTTNGTNGNARNFTSNRYRSANSTRGSGGGGSMKRARSVETISRMYSKDDPQQQQQVPPPPAAGAAQPNGRPTSLHEGELTGTFAINPIITPHVNKPKRLAPLITEREKPRADVVKDTMRIFEARPESRTRPPQHTGKVAANVATFKTIIIQTKQANTVTSKPPIKQKPVVAAEIIADPFRGVSQRKKPNTLVLKPTNGTSPLTSPLSPNATNQPASPVLSPVINTTTTSSTTNSTKPIASPIPDVSMVSIPMVGKAVEEAMKTTSLSETPDLILHSSPVHVQRDKERELYMEQEASKEKEDALKSSPLAELNNATEKREVGRRPVSPLTPQPAAKIEPLTLDITTYKSPVNNRDPVLVLSPREIEKNAINAACSPKTPSVISSNSSKLPPLPVNPPRVEALAASPAPTPAAVGQPRPKARKSKAPPEPNGIVINYSGRNDVPDYVPNDGHMRTQTFPMPEAGEGGITLLHGSTIQDVFGDEDESLRGPPSPCDVQFINDNVLIDGKSSLSKKSKKSKLKLQFVEDIPQVFVYPSESSMLTEDTPALNQPLGGTTVPSLAGSTLANYTPKSAASEFQLGVTKSAPPPTTATDPSTDVPDEVVLEPPMLFSSGTNADILF